MSTYKSEGGDISAPVLDGIRQAWSADEKNELVMNALGSTAFQTVALNRAVARVHDHQYTTRVGTEPKALSQKASGRCWLFAFISTVRPAIMDALKLDDVQLSANWLAYWDKFEKSNWLLEAILKTVAEPVEGRLVSHLLTTPVNDGGQYDMIINLVEKYGMVPESAYPEADASGNTRVLNRLVTKRLREFAMVLRKGHEAGRTLEELRETKRGQLEEIHRILTAFLGQPPTEFDWTYRNKDKATTKRAGLTPRAFYEEFVRPHLDVAEQVSLINDPRNEYYRLYTVEHLGNVVGGRPVLYVNVPIEVLSELTTKTLDAGRPVWFGCDVGKHFDRQSGVMDMDLFRYDLTLGVKFEMGKADRLVYGESLMTHAMVFTGYDAKDGEVQKYRVLNSWSEKVGSSGYMSMSAAWFREYMYQIVLPKADLPADVVAVLEQEPVALPAWDPMGSLAQ